MEMLFVMLLRKKDQPYPYYAISYPPFPSTESSTQTTMTTISMQLPDDAEPGDVLTFSVQGQPMEIIVPVGSKAGDILEIQVDSNERTDDDTEDLITKLDLGEGRILELSSELPKEVELEEMNDENDGTYALPWWSGIEMARRWNEFELDVAPRRVLELGSGLGLVGMSFAAKRLSKDATILLTDLPSAMQLLNHNIERNESLFPCKLHARPLRWAIEDDDNDNHNMPPYDCILGSDLLYNVEMVPPLVATIKRLLHPTRGVFLLGVRWRKPELERDFFRDTGLDWTLLPSSSGCQLSWQEFGNPSNEKSNLYFHQTQISIQGKPKALADITDEETKQLSTVEFEAWERAHIQIYIGKRRRARSTV
jgi:predicted nicotinamide N-methyase